MNCSLDSQAQQGQFQFPHATPPIGGLPPHRPVLPTPHLPTSTAGLFALSHAAALNQFPPHHPAQVAATAAAVKEELKNTTEAGTFCFVDLCHFLEVQIYFLQGPSFACGVIMFI